MLKVNPHYEKLPGSYLFAEIARRVKEYGQEHPDAQLIRLGIGDVTPPAGSRRGGGHGKGGPGNGLCGDLSRLRPGLRL